MNDLLGIVEFIVWKVFPYIKVVFYQCVTLEQNLHEQNLCQSQKLCDRLTCTRQERSNLNTEMNEVALKQTIVISTFLFAYQNARVTQKVDRIAGVQSRLVEPKLKIFCIGTIYILSMKMSSCEALQRSECLMSGGSDNRLNLYYIISNKISYVEQNYMYGQYIR